MKSPILFSLVFSFATLMPGQSVHDKKPIVLDSYVVQEKKPDVLFRGTDISVVLDKDSYPVRDVDGFKWVVSINGQDKAISAKLAPVNLKITTGLKLTEVAAKISGFTQTPGYSFANDPVVIMGRAQMKAAMTNAMLLGVAQDARDLEDTLGNAAMGAMATFAASDKVFGDAAMMFTAQTAAARMYHPKVTSGHTTVPSNPFVPTTFDGLDGNALALRKATIAARHAEAQTSAAREPLGRLVSQGYDAMNVDFSIQSAKPLFTPYVVTIALFHDVKAKPGTLQRLVFAKDLNPIESQISHVHFSEEGFPFDYELVDFQVHIYNRGIEIPTNLSTDRIDMSRDEAFDYIKKEYVAAHKGSTRPPVVAMGKFPAELLNRLAAGDYSETFYIRVSRDGLAEAAFSDSGCSKAVIDPFLLSIVGNIRFKPALANGEPTEGVAPLDLNKLQI